jgi:hypothetical protein
MRKLILALSSILTLHTAAVAQQVSDMVSIGTGYPNQTWYSLENDEKGSIAINTWDIAFNLRDLEASVRINAATGVALWGYPKANKTGWATVDTNGLSTWPERYNSDSSWSWGAMGNYIDPSNPWDVDWGIYDINTHEIYGDSLYIIKLGNGDYKKLMIVSLIKGNFIFKYANLDGSNEQSVTIKKTDYADKNFAYYSIKNATALNPEPNNDEWDLLFTRYQTIYEDLGNFPYVLTGVLSNKGVTVAECREIADPANYKNWQAHGYETPIDEIGSDWKVYDMQSSSYEIEDSLVYFVKTQDEAVWQLIFTDFVPTGGEFHFLKQKLAAAHINDANGKNSATIALAPNPASGNHVNLVYNFSAAQTTATVYVCDMAGRIVHTAPLEKVAGFHQYIIPTGNLTAGTYMVAVDADNGRANQKLIVQ